MARKPTKVKKVADAKEVELEVPLKIKGKAKVNEVQEDIAESEAVEKKTTEKKTKRGQKTSKEVNGQSINGEGEEIATKKKGKNKVPDNANEETSTNGDDLLEDSSPTEVKDNGDAVESNADSEQSQEVNSKSSKKKQKVENKIKESGQIKKPKQIKESQTVNEKDEVEDEKPKSTSKGRGRKPQIKVKNGSEEGEKADLTDEPKVTTKGRKKATATKKKSPEKDDEHLNEKTEVYQLEESKKKETKGKRKDVKRNETSEESTEKAEEPASKKRRTGKKDDKAKGDINEEPVVDEIVEEKASKGKKGNKKAAGITTETGEEPLNTDEQPSKRRRKNIEDKAPIEDKKKPALKNKAVTNYEELDFINMSKTTSGKEWNFKISSWNVDGIRAWFNKGGLDYLQYEKPDILCLQEVKCSQDKLPDELVDVPGYHAYWLCSDKDGYAGVGIYTSKLAMNVQYGLQNEELDNEGRIITAEYEHFYLISTYVPNAGRKLVTLPKRLQWNDEFRKYVKGLDKKKPVIICGDMNVAHNEIDLANPKTNRKNAGFTDEERSGMTELLGDGFVDTFRHLNPDKTEAYTFWTYMMNSRAKNVGW
ncbi:hypothetical protein ACJJTC_007064 [Scirpophaga incertulas]